MRKEEPDAGRWRLIYAAVALNTLVVYAALWWFSRAFD